MQTYQFSLELVWNVFTRGFHFCFCLVLALYFAFLKRQRPKFSYMFAFCQLTLILSLSLGTIMRTYNIFGMTFEVEGLMDMMIVPSFAAFFYTMVNQTVSWLKIILVWSLVELPIVLGIFGYIYTRNPMHQTYVGFYIIAFCVIGLIWSGIRARKFNRDLENSYADNDDRNLVWFNTIIMTMIAFFIIYLLAMQLFDLGHNPALQPIYFLLTEVCMIVLAYFVNKQESVDTDIMMEVSSVNHDKGGSIDNDGKIIASVKKKLVEEFEKKELYRQQGINIKNIAHMLGTNVKYVSICINREYKKNFNQYVNDLRLRKSKEVLMTERDKTVDEVATSLGFSTTATFWRVFQLEYGCSPTQFRNRETAPEVTPNSVVKKNSSKGHVDLSGLTIREKQLCQLIVKGADTEQQIKEMGISKNSLIVMKSRLKKKLNLARNESLRLHLIN